MEKVITQGNSSLSDEEIITGIIAGNKNAYEVIMRRYNQRLFRIGHGYLKNEEEIEDVIQTTYIKAYEQLSRFEGRSSFSTWLIRIFINEALLCVKQNSRYCRYSDDINISRFFYALDLKENEIGNPYHTAINNELKEILENAVNGLPEKYRAVFIMREIEDMNISETSMCLNISETNVKVRLSRAKEMLRENLIAYYHYSDVYSFNLIRCSRIVEYVLNRITKQTTEQEQKYENPNK